MGVAGFFLGYSCNDFLASKVQTTQVTIISYLFSSSSLTSCGLYYKCFTIIIYNHNDSGQYYKTTIMIIIDDPS
jgi:hypothetical protein